MLNLQRAKFDSLLSCKAEYVNRILRRILSDTEIDSGLRKAINYTMQAPGKRVRAAMVLWCCELVAGRATPDAQTAAAAIEMVHTYSLIHDDLPAMDNDDFRRGRPSCHKAFSEATAILAGDALLTLAFEVLSSKIREPKVSVTLIRELAQAAGPAGMIAGQIADLKSEKIKGSRKLLEYIHINKTAKMFRCAAAMGAICGGALREQYEHLCDYGLKTGLAFQITDDILDVCGSSMAMGKTAGKDVEAGKLTYPSLVGLEKSQRLAAKLAGEAVVVLEPFGRRAEILRQLPLMLTKRLR